MNEEQRKKSDKILGGQDIETLKEILKKDKLYF